MSFIFGGDTGITWEQAQAKRKLAEELARANMSTPRNVGEGLNALGRALAYRGITKRAGEAENRLRGDANAAFDSIFGMGGFTPTTSTSGPGADAAVPSVVRPEAADAYREMNRDSALPDALVRSESGGNFRAQNDVPGSGGVGHFGRGQFSIGRMQDAKNAGVIPASMTPEQFMASPDAQRAVEAWHVQDINNFINGNGLAQFEGQTIGGVPVTREGMINVAHLGGNNGLRRFLETGGQYNPADANGTRLSDYLAMGAGGGRQPAPTMSAQGRPPASMEMAMRLAQLAGNPALDPGRRALVKALLGQTMQAMQPQSEADRLDLELKRLQLEQARNPQPDLTTSQREYEFARQQGFEGSFLDYQTALAEARRAQTTVNNNMPANGAEPIGTKGAILVPDPTTESGFRIVYAENSEAEREQRTAERGSASAAIEAQQGLDIIDRVMNDPALEAVTGIIQGRLPARTQAQQDLLVSMEQIQGKAFMAAFESLKGGGQITEKEGAAAEAAMARLNRAQSLEAYQSALQELRDIFSAALGRTDVSAPTPATAAPAPAPASPVPAAPAAGQPAPAAPASIPEADARRALQGLVMSPNFDLTAWEQMPLEAQQRAIRRWLEQNP